MRRKEPDKVPKELSFGAFTPALMEVYYQKTGTDITPEEYFDFDTRSVRFLEPEPGNKFDRYFRDRTVDKIKSWGTAVRSGSKYHFTQKVSQSSTKESISGGYHFRDIIPPGKSTHHLRVPDR